MTATQPGEVAVRTFQEPDRVGLIRLWETCGLTRSWNEPGADIDRSLSDGLALLVAVDGDDVVGSVMVGYDGHRGWVNYLSVAPGQEGRGVGRRLMGLRLQADG
jgi:ribosomal protein S18 acetylase RimI-like enzyme